MCVIHTTKVKGLVCVFLISMRLRLSSGKIFAHNYNINSCLKNPVY